MLASLRKAGSFARVSPFQNLSARTQTVELTCLSQAVSAGQRRFLSIHEYQSVNLLNSVCAPRLLLPIGSPLTLRVLVRGPNSERDCREITQGGH